MGKTQTLRSRASERVRPGPVQAPPDPGDVPECCDTRALIGSGRLIVALPWVGLAVALVSGAVLGLSVALIVLAATTLLMGVSNLWSSVQALGGEVDLEAAEPIGWPVPSAELEQKREVLQALKDLDLERSLGKITEEDYQELRERFRAKAKLLLQALEQEVSPTRAEAEAVVDAFLRERGVLEVGPPTSGSRSNGATPKASGQPQPSATDESHRCSDCGTHNDVDAVFCKKCGNRMSPNGTREGRPHAPDR